MADGIFDALTDVLTSSDLDGEAIERDMGEMARFVTEAGGLESYHKQNAKVGLLEKAQILRSMVLEDRQVVELLDEILSDCLEGYRALRNG